MHKQVCPVVALSEADSNLYKRIFAQRCRSYPSDNPAKNIIPYSADYYPKNIINEYGEAQVCHYKLAQKRLSDEEIELAAQEYQAGKTTYEIAEKMGCHRQTVARALKAKGIEVSRCKAQQKLDPETVIRLYAEFHTSGEIAKLYDVHPNVILKCLREHGVEIRSRHDYPKKPV